MPRTAALLVTLTLLGMAPAHAINAKYAQQLERSGCTQVTEAQGCDIHKTKAANANCKIWRSATVKAQAVTKKKNAWSLPKTWGH